MNLTEGRALEMLASASEQLKLRPSTAKLLRMAIADHFDACADTLRDPSAALEFCAREAEGEQAPSRPLTTLPPALSDAGFELE